MRNIKRIDTKADNSVINPHRFCHNQNISLRNNTSFNCNFISRRTSNLQREKSSCFPCSSIFYSNFFSAIYCIVYLFNGFFFFSFVYKHRNICIYICGLLRVVEYVKKSNERVIVHCRNHWCEVYIISELYFFTCSIIHQIFFFFFNFIFYL